MCNNLGATVGEKNVDFLLMANYLIEVSIKKTLGSDFVQLQLKCCVGQNLSVSSIASCVVVIESSDGDSTFHHKRAYCSST